jgi:hypothetical protein
MNAPHEPRGSREDDQQQALAASRGDRDRALSAMRALEGAAGQAGPGRDQAWRSEVMAAIAHLQSVLADQQASYADPTSLMAQIAQDNPRLRTLVRQLHHRWSDLAATTKTLADTLSAREAADAWTIADVREQLSWLMTALHHHRAREADLIFSALEVDITT